MTHGENGAITDKNDELWMRLEDKIVHFILRTVLY